MSGEEVRKEMTSTRTKGKIKCGMCNDRHHETCRVVISNGVHGLLWCPCECVENLSDDYKEGRIEMAVKNHQFSMRSGRKSG